MTNRLEQLLADDKPRATPPTPTGSPQWHPAAPAPGELLQNALSDMLAAMLRGTSHLLLFPLRQLALRMQPARDEDALPGDPADAALAAAHSEDYVLLRSRRYPRA